MMCLLLLGGGELSRSKKDDFMNINIDLRSEYDNDRRSIKTTSIRNIDKEIYDMSLAFYGWKYT